MSTNQLHSDTQKFFKGKNVTITGGTGFIGSHVVDILVDMGLTPRILTRQDGPRFLKHVMDKVELVKCDLSDYGQTLEAIKGSDVVLNLAAEVAGIEYNKKHPATIFQQNMEMFINTIKASQVVGVERFLVTSSACVYPRHCQLPTPEEDGFKDEPEPTNAGYGWSKRMEEFLGRMYAEEFGMSVAIARPYNAYGPRDNFDPDRSHFIPSLIRKAYLSKNGEFEVWGDGTHSRSMLYVEDYAYGSLEVAARYPQADALNIGADEEVTVGQVAHAISEIVTGLKGQTVKPKFNPQGVTGQPRRHCDTRKALEKIGFEAKTPFLYGLKTTIDWYVKNENSADHSH